MRNFCRFTMSIQPAIRPCLNMFLFIKRSPSCIITLRNHSTHPEEEANVTSPRVEEFRKKLREKTPIGKLDEFAKHPYEEKEPLEAWPDNTNPNTGEIGGPRGPEPTRYGDWERKGKVTDF